MEKLMALEQMCPPYCSDEGYRVNADQSRYYYELVKHSTCFITEQFFSGSNSTDKIV